SSSCATRASLPGGVLVWAMGQLNSDAAGRTAKGSHQRSEPTLDHMPARVSLLHPVQDFISLVESRASLLVTRKARRIVEIADDPHIFEMQLRRELKLNRHARETPGCAGGSSEEKFVRHRT